MLALKNIPLSLFTPSSSDESPVCAICIDTFKDGDELRNLNCSHCFHRACVDIWLLGTLSDDLQLNGTCPTCRQKAAASPKKPVNPSRRQPRASSRTGSSELITVQTATVESVDSIGTIPSTRSSCRRHNGNMGDVRPALEEIGDEIDNGMDEPLQVDIPELTCFQIGAFLAEGSPGGALPASGKKRNVHRRNDDIVRLNIDTSPFPQSQLPSGLESITSVSSAYHMVNLSPPKDPQIKFHAGVDTDLDLDDHEDIASLSSLSSLSDSVFSDCGIPLVEYHR
jgi:hypothetical protein